LEPKDVPAGPIALDTDVFSFLHVEKGPYKEFAPFVAGREIGLPFSVIGELRAFAIVGKWGTRRVAELERAIRLCTPIASSDQITSHWSLLHSRFRGRLKDGGANDMWTAACCLTHGLPLLTNNLSDFQTIAAEFPALTLVHPDL